MAEYKLFHNECSGCGKSIATNAIGKTRSLPKVYCDSLCKTNANDKTKMRYSGPIVKLARGMSTDEITYAMSKTGWNLTKEEQIRIENQKKAGEYDAWKTTTVKEEIPGF